MIDFPEECVFGLDGVRLSLDQGEHPWHVAEQAAIESRWAREKKERPWLYNGTVMMHRGLSLTDGTIRGVSHRVPYAAMLQLEAEWPDADAWHMFGSAIIVSSDNAMLLVRMAAKTANPGKVCAPAGLVDENDIIGDQVDIVSNILREAREETGIDLTLAGAENRLLCWRQGRLIVIFRRFRLSSPASVVAERMRHHIRTDHEQEIEDVVIVRSPADAASTVPRYMKALIDFHFASPEFIAS